MDVILAIKPEFAKKIFNGQKRFEFRTRIWVKYVDKVYLYASKPLQKIVGYFTIEEIISGNPSILWRASNHSAGITKEAFFDYFNDKHYGYAIKIEDVFKFKKPVEPFKLSLDFKAPLSFHYIYPGPFKEKLEQVEVI